MRVRGIEGREFMNLRMFVGQEPCFQIQDLGVKDVKRPFGGRLRSERNGGRPVETRQIKLGTRKMLLGLGS